MTTTMTPVDIAPIRAALERIYGSPVLRWNDRIRPVQLHRARVVFARQTHAYIEERDRVFREELQLLWRAARLKPLTSDLAVLMTFAGSGQAHLRPDATNLAKAVEDAGNGFLWKDDQQIRVLVIGVEEWHRRAQDHISIEVWELERDRAEAVVA